MYKYIFFFVLFPLFLQCNSSKKGASRSINKTKLVGNWTIESINGKQLNSGSLEFNEDGMVGGNGGCNIMGGMKVIHDGPGKLHFNTDEVFSTMMACPKDEDEVFMDALNQVDGYVFTGNELHLKSGEKILLVLSGKKNMVD